MILFVIAHGPRNTLNISRELAVAGHTPLSWYVGERLLPDTSQAQHEARDRIFRELLRASDAVIVDDYPDLMPADQEHLAYAHELGVPRYRWRGPAGSFDQEPIEPS